MDEELEVTVDGVSYPYSALSDKARAQLTNLQFVDAEIARLQARLAVYQTARIAYNNALNDLLPRSRQ
jgi:hypothetical protein